MRPDFPAATRKMADLAVLVRPVLVTHSDIQTFCFLNYR